jgi:hypothetical protein
VKNVPGIVEQAVDLAKLALEAHRVHIQIRDSETLVERETQSLAQRRERLGRLLVEARRGFNARGDGFVRWVEDIGVAYTTAQRYMEAVGYVPPKKPGAGRPENQNHNGFDSSPRERDRDAPPEVVSAVVALPDGRTFTTDVASTDLMALVPAAPRRWMSELEDLIEDFQKLVQAAFFKAERIEALCAEHEATVLGNHHLLTARSKLVAVKTTASLAIKKLGGSPNG